MHDAPALNGRNIFVLGVQGDAEPQVPGQQRNQNGAPTSSRFSPRISTAQPTAAVCLIGSRDGPQWSSPVGPIFRTNRYATHTPPLLRLYAPSSTSCSRAAAGRAGGDKDIGQHHNHNRTLSHKLESLGQRLFGFRPACCSCAGVTFCGNPAIGSSLTNLCNQYTRYPRLSISF